MKHMLLIMLFAVAGLIAGCSTNSDVINIGDGKILGKPVEIEVLYTHAGVDYHAVISPDEGLSIEATDNLGNVYKVGYSDKNGVTLYLSPAGNPFVQSEDGKLVLSLPDGTTVKVKGLEDEG